MYFLLIVVTVTVVAVWYLSKKHGEEERSEYIARIRTELRDIEFYVKLTDKDGAATVYESTLINWINEFGGKVFTFPNETVAVPQCFTRTRIHGTFWQSKDVRTMAEDLNFVLKMTAPDERILGSKHFTAPKKDQEALFLHIMGWIARPTKITVV